MTSARNSFFLSLVLGAGLVVGCGETTPVEEAAPVEEVAAPAEVAPVEAAPVADAGMASGRMMGSWGVALGDEDKAKLDAAKATLATTPDDPTAKMLVGMMEGMLAALSLNVEAGTMTMGMGENVKTLSYTVSNDTAEGCTLTAKEGENPEETIAVAIGADGVMTWTKAGEANPIRWAKK